MCESYENRDKRVIFMYVATIHTHTHNDSENEAQNNSLILFSWSSSCFFTLFLVKLLFRFYFQTLFISVCELFAYCAHNSQIETTKLEYSTRATAKEVEAAAKNMFGPP